MFLVKGNTKLCRIFGFRGTYLAMTQIHIIVYMDADLIMLALATHEVHFSILREIVFTPGEQDKCFLCGQMGHLAADCEGKAKRKSGEFDEKNGDATVAKKPYQFLNIWTLREYLEYEMRFPNPPFEIDFERIVDDFIFMCFFVGNDFLPHMPTLEIREGAINLLIAVYEKEFSVMGGYLTDASKYQAERITRDKAQARRGDDAEPQIKPELLVPVARFHGSRLASAPSPSPFQKMGSALQSEGSVLFRKEHHLHRATADLSVLEIESGQTAAFNKRGIDTRAHKVARVSAEGATIGAAIVEAENSLAIDIRENKEELKSKLKGILREKSDLFNSGNPEEDKVRLGEQGWKQRYYEEKFSARTPDELETIRKDVILRYTEGLCWVMHYYYEGVCSWQWFYPYHYAPFASDLKDLDNLEIGFQLGSPFRPFNQLMGVFPAASSHALPVHYRRLMTDSNSPIIDFYPTDFEVDMNGKRYAWQGIAKLPFIDEARLLTEIKKVEHTLTEEEVRRNSVMYDMLFVTMSHPLSPCIFSLDDRCKQLSEKERAEVKEKIDPKASCGMNGYLSLCSGDPCPPIFRSPVGGLEDIMNNQVLCAIYKLPDAHKHITQPPPGVIFPKKTVTHGDLKPAPVLWHEDNGRRPLENGSYRQNPPGTISGRQLGEAAHRLVVNSLQVKMDRNGVEQMHPTPFHDSGVIGASPYHPYAGHNSQEQRIDRVEYPGHGGRFAYPAIHSDPNNGYGQSYASQSMHHQYDVPANPQYGRPANPQYERNQWRSLTVSHGFTAPRENGGYGSYPHGPAPRENGGYGSYPHGPAAAQPSSGHSRGGYNGYRSHQSYGAGQWIHQQSSGYSSGWGMPPANQIRTDGGHVHSQQASNRYSALDRGSSRRPAPTGRGYGNY